MNRPIKFRAWDGKNFYLFGLTKGSLGNEFYRWPDTEETPEFTDYQQYTGLKDKNGKEIYEGDIVTKWETRRWNKSRAEKSYRFPSYRRVVKWHTSTQRNGWNIYRGSVRSFEVIGNIYENKKLLK